MVAQGGTGVVAGCPGVHEEILASLAVCNLHTYNFVGCLSVSELNTEIAVIENIVRKPNTGNKNVSAGHRTVGIGRYTAGPDMVEPTVAVSKY